MKLNLVKMYCLYTLSKQEKEILRKLRGLFELKIKLKNVYSVNGNTKVIPIQSYEVGIEKKFVVDKQVTLYQEGQTEVIDVSWKVRYLITEEYKGNIEVCETRRWIKNLMENL